MTEVFGIELNVLHGTDPTAEPEFMGTTDPVPEPEPAGELGTCFKSVVIAVAILTTVIGTVGNVLVILVVARTGRCK